MRRTPLVRVHSECLTGDVLGSARCDCGPQLRESVERIADAGGYLLYLRQEGRGIGLYAKLDAYALQDDGLDTYEANVALGYAEDERDYTVAAQMLQALGERRVALLTNNPDKAGQLTALGHRGRRAGADRGAPVHEQRRATSRPRCGTGTGCPEGRAPSRRADPGPQAPGRAIGCATMSENASPVAAPASDSTAGEYTHRQILTILSGLMLGMFLGALDQTIVSTSIRTIADDLNGLSMQAWVTTAYLITATITTPIYGKLGDNYGRKKLFMFAITVFIVGSALCSFATSMPQLAAFRAFQGLGAGGLFTLVLAIIGDIVSPRERARYTGYFMAMFGTSSVLGPLIGGFFAGQAVILGIDGWRWVFLVNVPIGIVALLVVYRTLHVHHTPRHVRIDWWGAIALVVCLVPLLTVAEQGRQWGWTSPRSLTALAVGTVGAVAFVLAERMMGDAALIPLRIFRLRAAAVAIASSVIIGMAMFGGIMLIPQYMQIVHGASPTEAGLLMLPMVVGMMTGSISAGQVISRTGHIRMFPIVGSAVMVVGLTLLSRCGADTAMVWVSLSMLVLGLGLGNCLQPILLIVQNAVPPTEIGVATSASTFFRQIGGTLGVAIFLSVLFSTVGGNIKTAIEADSQTPEWRQAVAEGHVLDPSVVAQFQDDSSFIEKLDPVLAHPFKVGFAESMDLVFMLAAGVGVLAFLILLLLPAVELRATSASAAARAEAAGPPE